MESAQRFSQYRHIRPAGSSVASQHNMIQRFDQLLYPGYQDHWDSILLRDAISKHLHPNAVVLDLGAGRGGIEYIRFRGQVKMVCGIDRDSMVLENPHLDQSQVASGERIPYPDDHFDVVFSNNVMEHLDNPLAVVQEIARVLKPGGVYIFKTPNLWHYVAIIASCTPHWFHELFNRWRGRSHRDTFPTVYKANTRRSLQALARQANLEIEQLEFIEGRPEYLRINSPMYLAGWVYERMVNRVPGLWRFRVVMIGEMRKTRHSQMRDNPG